MIIITLELNKQFLQTCRVIEEQMVSKLLTSSLSRPPAKNEHIGFLVGVIRVQMLPWNLLDHREGRRHGVPEGLMRLRRPDLVPEQHHPAVGVGEHVHGSDEVGHGFRDVDDVGGDDEVEAARGGEGGEVRGAVPVELGEAWGAREVAAVAAEVAAERGEHRGDVREDEVGEAEAERPRPAGPQPEPSSTARVPGKRRTSAKGSAGSRRQRSANLTRTREEGHTEVPTSKESLSCSNVSTAPPTGSSTTGDAVKRILLRRRRQASEAKGLEWQPIPRRGVGVLIRPSIKF